MAVRDTTPPSYLVDLLLICCVCGCYGNSCFPVAEGDSCTLTCEVKVTSPNLTILWAKTAGKEPVSALFTCSPHSGVCNSSSNAVLNQYQAKISSKGGTDFISHLTIQQVQSSYKDVSFSCLVFDNFDPELTSLRTFQVSVYALPFNVSCNADFVFPDKIEVSCHTKKIYPEPLCKIYSNTRNGKELDTQDISFRYKKTFSPDTSYSASCFAVIHIHQPGKYKYRMLMVPNVKTVEKAEISPLFTETNQVIVEESLLSLLVPPVVHLCHNSQQKHNLSCTALWFEFPFELRWIIGQKIEEKKMSANKQAAKFYSLQSTYEYVFNRPWSRQEEVVRCELYYMNGNFTGVAQEKTMGILWAPSRPPKFQYGGADVKESHDIHIREGEDVDLTCLVEGGNPPVSSLHLQCRSSDQSMTLLDKSWYGSKAEFTLRASEHLHKSSCVCSADHVTHCYNLKTTVTISVVPHVEPTRSDSTPFYLNRYCIILYVLLTLAAAVCTAGIAVVYMFCCRTCKMYRHRHHPHPTSSRVTSNPRVPDIRDLPVSRCRYQPAHSAHQASASTRM